jgi:hypothetical protein
MTRRNFMSRGSLAGRSVEGAETTSTRKFFTGKLDNLQIRCGTLAHE